MLQARQKEETAYYQNHSLTLSISQEYKLLEVMKIPTAKYFVCKINVFR